MNVLIKTNGLNFMNLIHYPDIEITAGKATFIQGESGCGKSTLLKLFNGVLSANEGTIEYNGKNTLNYDTITLRKEVLLCAQSVFLFNDTINGNFKQFYQYRGEPLLCADSIRDYLHLCNLDFDIEAPCETMSGGERHRVFIALCLSFQPKVLLLDEPTAALDSQNADTLMHNVISFCKEHDITPIIVCHDNVIAEKYADDMISLMRKR